MDLINYSWKALTRLLPDNIPVFYRTNPHLSFAAREVESIKVGPHEWEVTLNFMGLQGASTPLPIHFSERIVQEDPEDSNLNAFYNFFNHQTYKTLLAIEKKYAYLPSITPNGSDALTTRLTAFAGLLPASDSEAAQTILPFLGNMLGRNLEKRSVCRVIARLFACECAWVVECMPVRLAIPNANRAILGKPCILGETVSLGAYITQAKNHLELHLEVNVLENYLPNQALFQKLQTFVGHTLRENLFISVVFHAKKARTAALHFADPVGLGWSTRLGRAKIEAYTVKLKLI